MVCIRRENDACNVTLFVLFSRLGCNVGVVQIIFFVNDDRHISAIFSIAKKEKKGISNIKFAVIFFTY